MDIYHVLTLVGGLLAGLIAGLKVLAPILNKPAVNAVLADAEKVEQVVQAVENSNLLPKPAPAPAPAVPAVAPVVLK